MLPFREELFPQNDYEEKRALPYCLGNGFVRVLIQDFALLHGVIAFVKTHSKAPLFAVFALWVSGTTSPVPDQIKTIQTIQPGNWYPHMC